MNLLFWIIIAAVSQTRYDLFSIMKSLLLLLWCGFPHRWFCRICWCAWWASTLSTTLWSVFALDCSGMLRQSDVQVDFTQVWVWTSVVCFLVTSGFTRSTACWLHSTTQHNHHGTTPNTWVSHTSGMLPGTFYASAAGKHCTFKATPTASFKVELLHNANFLKTHSSFHTSSSSFPLNSSHGFVSIHFSVIENQQSATQVHHNSVVFLCVSRIQQLQQ